MHSKTYPSRKSEWPEEFGDFSSSSRKLRGHGKTRKSKTQGLGSTMRPVRTQKSSPLAVGSGAKGVTAQRKAKRAGELSGRPSQRIGGASYSMSTKTGGLTFGSNFHEGEMDVVRTVLLREEYLHRLEALAASYCRRNVPDALPDLLDLLRIATVEVVEAVKLWRQNQSRQVPFMWNGVNYLLKISSDLDFLDQYPIVTKWLGFSLNRNPFCIPMAMDQRPSSKGELLRQTVKEELYPASDQGFLRLGDTTGSFRDMFLSAGPGTKSTRSGGASSSALGDVDMLRVRDCEKIILQEEELHGRYLRAPNGRLVPIDKANREHLHEQLRQDDHLDMREPGHAEEALAPFTEIAGPGRREKLAKSLPIRKRPEVDVNSLHSGSTLPGRIRPERLAGELHPLSTRGTKGRKRKPVRRSQGALLDLHLEAKKKRVAEELADLRAQLESAERRLAEAEVEAAADWEQEDVDAAVALQSVARHLQTRRMDTTQQAQHRAELERQQRELQKREERKAREAEKLAFLEEQRAKFKERQRRSHDSHRASVLERKRRLLEAEDRKSLTNEGPHLTLEDVSAIQVQKIVRGVQGRALYRQMRARFHTCATIIQSGFRGMQGRKAAKRKKITMAARVTMQKLGRGYLARKYYRQKRKDHYRNVAASTVQRTWRGLKGRRRHAMKKELVRAANAAAEAVSRAKLFPSDITELSELIGEALYKENIPYPPAIYLGVLRVVVGILGGGRTQRITVLDSLGVKNAVGLEAGDLNWDQARKILRRGLKFIRLLRRTAAGPAGNRPRLLFMPDEGLSLYNSYKNDPMWTTDLKLMDRPGGKAIRLLIFWIEHLVTVWQLQDHFLDDVGSSQPQWMGRFLDGRKNLHVAKLKYLGENRAYEYLQGLAYAEEALDSVSDDNKGSDNVLHRVLKAQKLKANEAKNDLEQLEEAEKKLQEKEHQMDINDLAILQKELDNTQDAVEAAEEAYNVATEKAKLGGKLEERALPKLLQAWNDAKSKLKEVETQEYLGRLRLEATQRKKKKAPNLPTDLQVETKQAGELTAQLLLAEAERKTFAATHGGEAMLHELIGQDLHDLRAIDDRLTDIRTRSDKAWARVWERFAIFDSNVKNDYEEERRKEESPPLLWDQPTEAEFLQDQAEDEACAVEEAQQAQEFVPRELVAPTYDRPRPLLVLVGRDVPKVAKERIICQIDTQLPGLFVRSDLSEKFGLCSETFQNILSTGCSILAEVDNGIIQKTRDQFLQRLAMVKACLVPVPSCVLLIGHLENGTRDSGGVADQDLKKMQDAKIKRRLQIATDCLDLLSEGHLDQEMMSLSQLDTPPSLPYITVIEAVVILMSPEKHYRAPSENVSTVSWHVAKRVLHDPKKLAKGLKDVDKYKVPDYNLVVLEQYLRHEMWPGTRGKALTRRTDPVLYYLARWVTAVTEAAGLLGGPLPRRMDRRHPDGVFSSVVSVIDQKETTIGNQKAGWEAAYNALMSPVLEDMHVHRRALKIDGEMHTVNVYQDQQTIFFGAYNHSSSTFHITSVREDQVSNLLAPNSMERSEFGSHGAPKTREEMFSRLAELLVFEKDKRAHPITGEKERRLVCRRKLVKLWRGTLSLSGHLAMVTMYEEAHGNLRAHAYLPQFSRALELVVDQNCLLEVLPNAHSEHELPYLQSAEAPKMLHPVMDRLAISPGLTALQEMGISPKICRFKLFLRKRGGPGQMLYRQLIKCCGFLHVIKVNEVGGEGGSLWVRVYDASSSRETQLWLTPEERGCLFGSREGHPSQWGMLLRKRLSLRRYAVAKEGEQARSVHLDRTVFVGAKKLTRNAYARVRCLAVLLGEEVGLRLQTFRGQQKEMFQLDLANEVIQPLFGLDGSIEEILCSPRKQVLMNKIIDALKMDDHDVLLGNIKMHPIKSLGEVSSSEMTFKAKKDKRKRFKRLGTVRDVTLSRHQPSWSQYNSLEKVDWEDFPVRYVPEEIVGPGKTISSMLYAPEKKIRAQDKSKAPEQKGDKSESEEEEEPLPEVQDAVHSQKGEIIYKQGVMMKREGTREIGMVVTVWESYIHPDDKTGTPRSRPRMPAAEGGIRHLLFEIYDTRTCERAFNTITGEVELKEVVGAHNQHLLKSGDQEAVFYHICRERALIKNGRYNIDKEIYEQFGNEFSVIFEKDRLYSHLKQTPLHLGGEKDQEANKEALISKAPKRGIKVLRRVQKINGLLLHVTCYDIPRPHHRKKEKKYAYEEEEPVYRMRFVAYDPRSGHMTHVEVGKKAIYELVGGRWSPLLAQEKRVKLAEVVSSYLRLQFPYNKPPQLVLPWSGQKFGFLDADVSDSKSLRQPEERVRKRGGRLHSFGTVISGVKVIVNIFSVDNTNNLRVNVYSPQHAGTAEVEVPVELQLYILGGRSVYDYEAEEARKSAFENIARHLALKVLKEPKENGSLLELHVEVEEGKTWLAAYKQLDSKVPTSNRPTGIPLVFIPATTKGDLLLRRGVKVDGQEVLISVFSRAKGRPGKEGLVVEAYNPQTCSTAILHIGSPALHAQVNQNLEHLEPENMPRTIELLLYRLILQHDALGRLKLSINMRVMPSLFTKNEDLTLRSAR